MTRRHFIAFLVCAALFAAPTHNAFAQSYPTKPIRLIVPTAPAGVTDVVSRLLAQKLTEQMGQPVVVENRPGANGSIAAAAVAKMPGDGYTIFLGTIGVMSINPYVYTNVSYDPIRDFVPISNLVTFANVLVAHPSLPVTSVRELLAYAKERPGKLSYSSSGSGGSPHMAMALFLHMAGLDIVHVPYKGSAPAITDLLSGQVQLSFGDPIATLPHVRAGKLRALAVSGATRHPAAPDVPTLAEAGIPGYVVNGWLGLVAPAETPPEIVQRLNSEVVRAFSDPVIRERLTSLAAEPATGSSEELRRYIADENRKWSALVRDTKISAK